MWSTELQESSPVATARSATAPSVECGRGEGLPLISETRGRVEQVEERKAAAAWREAERRPTPPRDIGSEALDQAQSERGPPQMSAKAERVRMSKALAALRTLHGGLERRQNANLGKDRQERRSEVAMCESSRSPSLSVESWIFLTLFSKTSSQNSVGPIGTPKSSKPDEVEGISEGSGLGGWTELGGTNSKDFARLRCRPRAGPSCSTMWSAVARLSGEPHRVPSSRYQALMLREGTSCLIFSTIGWSATAKARGPRGSPCCTPHWLVMV